jgi:hypothetical protein
MEIGRREVGYTSSAVIWCLRLCSVVVFLDSKAEERTTTLEVSAWFYEKRILFLGLNECAVKSFLQDPFDLDIFCFVRVEGTAVVRFKFVALHFKMVLT